MTFNIKYLIVMSHPSASNAKYTIKTKNIISELMRPCYSKILTSNMALKQRHKKRWNGDKQHKQAMAYSSKNETTIFQIQTGQIRIPPPKRASLIESKQRKREHSEILTTIRASCISTQQMRNFYYAFVLALSLLRSVKRKHKPKCLDKKTVIVFTLR